MKNNEYFEMNKYVVHLLESKKSYSLNVLAINNITQKNTQNVNLESRNSVTYSLERFVRLIMKHGHKHRARLLVDNVLIALHELSRNVDLEQGKISTRIKTDQPSLNLLETSYEKDPNNLKQNARIIFSQALDLVRPRIEVRRVRVAGRTYMVPAAVPQGRSFHIAVKWLVAAANKRKASITRGFNNRIEITGSNRNIKFSFSKCLALELWDAYHYQGYARQERHELHQIALANRAFYHYRWWVK